jgi:uncharacterized protein (TIGR03067 family)
MRTLIPVALLFVFVGAHAGGKAPVPKDPPAATGGIDGKYNLVSLAVPNERAGGFAPAPAAGFPGAAPARLSTATMLLLGPAVITKNEITLEGRPGASSPLSALAAGATLPITMEYKLDATKAPMTIDIETTTLRGKKVKMLGVVEVVGNRLIIAVAKEGDDRPKTTDEGGDVTVYYFQKAPPPPKVEFKVVAMTAGSAADAEKELNKLAAEGYELVSTTNPVAMNDKAAPTHIHFVLKRTTK